MGTKFQEATAKLLEICRQAWLKKHGVPLPAPTLTAQQHAEIEECFEMLDQDGSGAIDVREIVHAFGALGFTISKDAIEELMVEADPDGSGELEFDEFLSLMGRALYHPDEHGKALVAKTGSGDLSFADMVRAFRRKKLIESLIRGGDARLKVVEFHEKVQELIRAETEELRQRQNTHAIYERMETVKAEREKLNKVSAPASQRAQKMKAKLQDAIGRSLGAFESLYRRAHTSPLTNDDPSRSSLGGALSPRFDQEDAGSESGEASPSCSGSRTSSPMSPPGRSAGGVTFLTAAHVVSSPAPPAAAGMQGVLRGLDLIREKSRPSTELVTSRSLDFAPLSQSPSTTSFDGTGTHVSAQATKRVSAAVLKYFKQLDEQTKKQEQKYDDAARLNASFIPPPPDRSDFTQALQPARPVSRVAQAIGSPGPAASIAGGPASAGASGVSGARYPSPGPSAGGSGYAVQHPHGWGVRQPDPNAGRGVRSSASVTIAGYVSHQHQRLASPLGTSSGSSVEGIGGSTTMAQRQPGVSAPEMRRNPEAMRERHRQGGPVTAAWADFVAATSAIGTLAGSPSASSVAQSSSQIASTAQSVMPSRAWRQAPAFGPAGSLAAPAFGWGSGMALGAGGRGGGSVSPSPGLATARSMGSEVWGVLPTFPRSGEAWDSWSGVAGRPPVMSSVEPGRCESVIETDGGIAADGHAHATANAHATTAANAHAARTVGPLPAVPRGAGVTFSQNQPPPVAAEPLLEAAAAASQVLSARPAAQQVGQEASGSGQGAAPAPAPAAERQPVRSAGPSSGGNGGSRVQGLPGPGPMARTFAAQSRSLGEALHGSAQSPSLSPANSLPASTPAGARNRQPGASDSRPGATSMSGVFQGMVLPGGGHGSSSGAVTLPGPGRRNAYFSHGPFRTASRGPAAMGSASGPAAAAMIEGIVSVSPAPALVSAFAVPFAAPALHTGGDARPRERTRVARLGARAAGAAIESSVSGTFSGSGDGDDLDVGRLRVVAGSRCGSAAGSGRSSRGPTGESDGRRGPTGESDGRRGPTGESDGRRGPAAAAASASAVASLKAAALEAMAVVTIKAATADDRMADMVAFLEDAGVTNAECQGTGAGAEGPQSSSGAKSDVAAAPAAAAPPAAAPAAAASAAAPKSPGRESTTSDAVTAQHSPRTAFPPLRSSQAVIPSDPASPAPSFASQAPSTLAPMPSRAPQPPPQPQPQPPLGSAPSLPPAQPAQRITSSGLTHGAAADGSSASASSAFPAASTSYSAFTTTGVANVVVANPAAPAPPAASPVPALRARTTGQLAYAPRGAYMSLQLAAQRNATTGAAAAQTVRSPRRGVPPASAAAAADAGGGGGAAAARSAVPQKPSEASRPTPLHDRVVVTFFGQQLPRASNGAVVLPAMPQPPLPAQQGVGAKVVLGAYAAQLPLAQHARAAAGEAGEAGSSMTPPPAHPNVPVNPSATTSAAAAAWLSSAGGTAAPQRISPGSPNSAAATAAQSSIDWRAAKPNLTVATPQASDGTTQHLQQRAGGKAGDTLDAFFALGMEPGGMGTSERGSSPREATRGALLGSAGRPGSRRPSLVPRLEQVEAGALGPWEAPWETSAPDSPGLLQRAQSSVVAQGHAYRL